MSNTVGADVSVRPKYKKTIKLQNFTNKVKKTIYKSKQII